MPEEKDTIAARLVVERGYFSQEQLDETLAAQKAGAEAMGVSVPLAQILVSRRRWRRQSRMFPSIRALNGPRQALRSLPILVTDPGHARQ